MITFEIEGLEELLKKLGVDLKPALKAATFAVGEQLRHKVATYPKMHHTPVLWSSFKQKRFYHAMRREKGLPLEYTRVSDPMSYRGRTSGGSMGGLGASWITEHSGEVNAKLTANAPYAQWVQGSTMQWKQHAMSGWVTDRQAIDQLVSENVIPDIVRDAVDGALERA